MSFQGDRALAPISGEVEEVGKHVVDAGLKVHLTMGPGLLETAYEHCLAFELRKRGIGVSRQVALPIRYGEERLEDGYRIDLLVQNSVIVEIKAIDELAPIHQAQLLTYLRMSGHRLGFLMNFNVRLFKYGLRRIVW